MTITLLVLLIVFIFYLTFFVLPKVLAAIVVSEIRAHRRRR